MTVDIANYFLFSSSTVKICIVRRPFALDGPNRTNSTFGPPIRFATVRQTFQKDNRPINKNPKSSSDTPAPISSDSHELFTITPPPLSYGTVASRSPLFIFAFTVSLCGRRRSLVLLYLFLDDRLFLVDKFIGRHSNSSSFSVAWGTSPTQCGPYRCGGLISAACLIRGGIRGRRHSWPIVGSVRKRGSKRETMPGRLDGYQVTRGIL